MTQTRALNVQHAAVNKLPRMARKAGKTRVKKPWRNRYTPCRKWTYAERKALLAKRSKKKADLNSRLKEIREIVWDHAVSLREELGGHNVKGYYRLILQQSSLKFKEPREIPLWNAFVHLELTRLNQGDYYILT